MGRGTSGSFGDWNYIYRPEELADMALVEPLRNIMQSWIDGRAPPNLLFVGSYGVGKSTAARILARRCSVLDGGEWSLYAYSRSFSSTRVASTVDEFIDIVSGPNLMAALGDYRPIYVLDEFDKLSEKEQTKFLSILEDQSHSCGFILNANNIDKVHDAIKDRCQIVSFSAGAKNKPDLVNELTRIGAHILNKEDISFNEDCLTRVAEDYWYRPRHFVKTLQTYSSSGRLTLPE